MTPESGGRRRDERPPASTGLPVGDLLVPGPVTVDLPIPAVALAVGAHPDDIEFGGGATLAKWASAGTRLHYVVLTDGSKGSWDPDADVAELASARMDECRAAARVVDGPAGGSTDPPGRIAFLQQVDGELENTAAGRRALTDIIRQIRPTVVLGHDPWRRYRLHPDHRAAGFLTVDALVAARDPHFFPESGLAPHRPRSLLLWEADMPNHVEDAGGFAETKIDALLCHRSQLESTMGIVGATPTPGAAGAAGAAVQGTAEFAAKVRLQLAQHGAVGGLASAEAFRLMADL